MAKFWTGHEKKRLFFTKCDLDLGATDLGLVGNTSSYDGQHLCQVISKSIKEKLLWTGHDKKTPFSTFDL